MAALGAQAGAEWPAFDRMEQPPPVTLFDATMVDIHCALKVCGAWVMGPPVPTWKCCMPCCDHECIETLLLSLLLLSLLLLFLLLLSLSRDAYGYWCAPGCTGHLPSIQMRSSVLVGTVPYSTSAFRLRLPLQSPDASDRTVN